MHKDHAYMALAEITPEHKVPKKLHLRLFLVGDRM